MKRQFTILLFLAAIFTYGCSDNKAAEKQPAAAPAEPHYALATADQKPVEQVYKLPAQLAAYQEVSIFPKVNGYVRTVLVDEGSHVRAGQQLMVLEAPELQEAVAQAREK